MSDTDLANLLAAVPLPAIAINQQDVIIGANAEAAAMINQNLVGRNYVTMLRQPALLDAIEATLQDGTSRRSRYFLNDGAQDTTFDVSCRAISNAANGHDSVLLCFSDISQLQQAGQMRRDFVANVSHELRTPLTALIGFIETLRGPARDDPAATDRFLGIMQGEGERMNRLVGDLLSLSRVEGDERVRPTAQIELIEHLESIKRTMAPLAQGAQVALELDCDVAKIGMTADADQLTQVFTNLIENAIKYGGSGGRVVLRVRASEREAVLRAMGVCVQVIDHGPGIDPVHLPRLTERFYRADDHRSRALGGTGLGLAIVKHIINRHRGRLRVESELGQGATFTVLMPIDSFLAV
ncbi:MAG: ATP-binding protein [Paracoccaceae bacterium]